MRIATSKHRVDAPPVTPFFREEKGRRKGLAGLSLIPALESGGNQNESGKFFNGGHRTQLNNFVSFREQHPMVWRAHPGVWGRNSSCLRRRGRRKKKRAGNKEVLRVALVVQGSGAQAAKSKCNQRGGGKKTKNKPERGGWPLPSRRLFAGEIMDGF